jgi:serine/threonine protein phosphatase PrpC
MPTSLRITLGQYSHKGRKATNQDFHGAFIPTGALLANKGIAVGLADGISTSAVSHIASESAVKSFLEDYFCTSDAWTVKKSAHCVLLATNSWLYSQTRQSQYRYEKDRGYICTFSALILKSNTAHLFHVGDARVYRLRDNTLEQLTNDHRVWLAQDEHYLSRALGMNDHLEIDYLAQPLCVGDIFFLATDGVYEFVTQAFVLETIKQCPDDLNRAAKLLVEQAITAGSADNVTVQLVRVDALPEHGSHELQQQVTQLPILPLLDARAVVDGYRIVRQLHASSRSHVYLAVDEESATSLVIKIPSIEHREDQAYLERFLLEDWIAHRLNSAFILRPVPQERQRSSLYITTEYLEGQTLRQWMIDHPKAELETARSLVDQIAKGLQAFHRLEMLHQDLRPENVMVDATGSVKIIDFGAVRVAGLEEALLDDKQQILGTAQYTAPEYFLGESGTPQSDQFALAVMMYEMLCGRLPYGADVAKTRTRAQQVRLQYQSVLDEHSKIPAWIDFTLRKALHPNPLQRYAELSEFLYDLRRPNATFLNQTRAPLLERNPIAFWRGLSGMLAAIVVALLIYILKQ